MLFYFAGLGVLYALPHLSGANGLLCFLLFAVRRDLRGVLSFFIGAAFLVTGVKFSAPVGRGPSVPTSLWLLFNIEC